MKKYDLKTILNKLISNGFNFDILSEDENDFLIKTNKIDFINKIISIRNEAISMRDKFNFISLGTQCQPREILTKYGFKRCKLEGEKTMPFDMAISSHDAVFKALSDNFNQLNNRTDFKETKLGPQDCSYGIIYNHENDKTFKDNNYKKLIERYHYRFGNFLRKAYHENTYFVIYTENSKSLYPILKLIIEKKYSKNVIILNHGEYDPICTNKFFGLNIIQVKCELPSREYVWFDPWHYLTDEGFKYESEIIKKIGEGLLYESKAPFDISKLNHSSFIPIVEKGYFTEEDVDKIRDYASSGLLNNIESYEIMKIAAKIRPNGHFIRKKLIELENKINLKKKKFYLHIGTGKTGSSSIQEYLDEYSKTSECNFHFCYDQTGYRAISNLNDFVNKMFVIEKDFFVYSNEWLCNATEEQIKSIFDTLSPYFDVKIILYLRRQDKFFVSFYQQVSKNREFASEYGPVAMPDVYRDDLDYHKKVCGWEKFFLKENIIIRIFEKEMLYNNDVVSDFLKIINIPKTDLIRIKKVNESNGFIKTKIGHLLNQSGLRNELPKLADSIFNYSDNKGKLLPAREKAQQFYLKYKESNKILNKKYLVNCDSENLFDDDFSCYPEEANEYWDEEKGNIAIISIFESLKKVRSSEKISADTISALRDLANNQLDNRIKKEIETIIKNIILMN